MWQDLVKWTHRCYGEPDSSFYRCIIIAEKSGLKGDRIKVFADDGNIKYCKTDNLIKRE